LASPYLLDFKANCERVPSVAWRLSSSVGLKNLEDFGAGAVEARQAYDHARDVYRKLIAEPEKE
jgi:hypothetical protein